MKRILLMLCLMFVATPAVSYDNQEFSNALGWEKKWNKIISKSTKRYLSRLEAGYFSKLSNKNKKSALTEMQHVLQNKLSWKTMGQSFTQNITHYCDAETLNSMVRVYNKEIQSRSEIKTIATAYSACAKKGYSESLTDLKKVMMESLSDVDPILEKYK